MGSTLIEKIFAHNIGADSVKAGDIITVNVDRVMIHDIFIPFVTLRRCSGKGLHLAMAGEPRGFSRVTAGFSSFDGEFRLPLVLAQASPIFHSSCEGKLGIALE